MPTVTNRGAELYYETDGEGETVAFVGEAGYGAWQWSFLYPQVAGAYEALVWDLRGSGHTESDRLPESVDDLVGDLEAVLSAHGAGRVHLAGAGLGGMVALRYARKYRRARSLALFGTAPQGGRVDEAAYRALGPRPADEADCRQSLDGALSPAFRDERDDLVGQICDWRREEDAPEAAFAAQVEAALGFESGPLYELTLPTLVFHGVDDPVVPAGVGEDLAADLPRGEFVAVEGRHLPYVEHAIPVADRWLDGLDGVGD
ncbi:alpha/beta fold hydrolase [Halobacteriales archaeon Cl-PHB]